VVEEAGAGSWDEERREVPENERWEPRDCKMQNHMQRLLELLQCRILLHFEDALADAASAGDGLRPPGHGMSRTVKALSHPRHNSQ
jgi:hypothetical protein